MRKSQKVEISCPVCLKTREVAYRTYSEVYKKSNVHNCLKCATNEIFKERGKLKKYSATNVIIVKEKPISKHQFYGTWCSMIARCYKEKNNRYKNYGARGITVCNEWMNSVNFIKWCDSFGEKPKGTQIDRIDNNGNYEPSNCRLVTPKENARNRSTTKLNMSKVEEIRKLYASGLSQNKIAKDFGITQTTVSEIILNKIWN